MILTFISSIENNNNYVNKLRYCKNDFYNECSREYNLHYCITLYLKQKLLT